MNKLVLAFSISILLLGISANAYAVPSQSEAYSLCTKKVQQRYGTYSGSDSGLRQQMQKHIEKCMAEYGYYSE